MERVAAMMWVLGWHVMLSSKHRLGLKQLAGGAVILTSINLAAQTQTEQPSSPEQVDGQAPAAVVETPAETMQEPPATRPEPEPVKTSPSAQTVLDYEASEQVSEDLSVSFPVDI